MKCTLTGSPASDILAKLYADADAKRANLQPAQRPAKSDGAMTPLERFTLMKDQYMPIDVPFGNLLYSLIRSSGAKTVVEFGTSFGISTIYLAAAVRDNGAGQVITTEFIAEKADVARQNLTDAALVDLIDFRVGDAMQTLLNPLPGPVDLLFLDGDKGMYVDIVKLLEPKMRPGCLIVSDNTDQEGAATYLEHVRNPANGYISTPLLTPGGDKEHSGHEVSVKL
ncbi:O-methyltransferase [Cerasicoccus fimbriatus]|uniref:O-methyltransferase n=1 Tax=Cerasicoccus fimbriatus TaxID=3014554 RepID=UPI0022B3351F|nr:class I SAM-dependent methyltransferase [Cerasicoccus sp. TK19100]